MVHNLRVISWEAGNLNDSVGNLVIKFPVGKMIKYINCEEGDEYCPLKIALNLQSGNSSSYAVNFKSDKIGVYSNGEIAEGLEDGNLF